MFKVRIEQNYLIDAFISEFDENFEIIRNIKNLKETIININDLGFVPTMGGLHKGHISLINRSKKFNGKTLVSIEEKDLQLKYYKKIGIKK